MGCRLTFAPKAIGDLRSIVSFIALDDPAKAREFGQLLIQKARLLEQQPEIGRVVPELQDPNIREIVFRHYRIVYRLRLKHQLVEVARFWHGARGVIEIH